MSFVREPDVEPIPGYRLIEPLGSGGFGEVWKCEAPGGIFKAIKFVFGNLNSLDVEGAKAEQELQALKRVKEIRHPFVLSLDRIEVVEGELVIVMELADRSLHDHFVECQSAGLVGIPRDLLLRFIRDAAEALDHMNEKHSLQHLDIKPRNLFLVSDRVKVADFGLVKQVELANAEGVLGGVTPLYASPETFSGKISGRSDQYSLAIVYQELLTGQRPFNGKNVRQLAQQHMQEEPELRSLPEAERAIVARALSKDPAKRYPSCLTFLRALYGARATRPEAIIADGTGKQSAGAADLLDDLQIELLSPEDAQAGGIPAVECRPDVLVSKDEVGDEGVSHLGITVAQPQTGPLRPTVLIGLGTFGRQILQELRCRFLDRFGDMNRMPLLRFLYLDTDQEAIRAVMRGTPEVAFTAAEIHHLPLQPVGHYRRRQLDQLSEWLPREKFYALPRSLQTLGSRALGRLAYSDNYLRLLARLKREIQQVTHPDALYRSVTETGLALRDNVPRVYVVAAAGGGSSGFLADIGYTLRRTLQQMRHADAQVTSLVFCGAPDDPATPRTEQANILATLTELNHYTDTAVSFAAHYGADGPRLVDQGNPFDATYLLISRHRTPEGLRDTIAHVGSYLFHDMMTPLGLRLDRQRQMPQPHDASPFRSMGTYAVWFPRGLLLRLAARRACRQIVEDWQATNEPKNTTANTGPKQTSEVSKTSEVCAAGTDADTACSLALGDPELRAEALAVAIERAASVVLEDTPAAALTSVLVQLEEQAQQSLAQDDPGSWARQALARVREWLGTGLGTGSEGGDWHKSRLGRALEIAIQKVADPLDKRLTEACFGLMDLPGQRVAAAEMALERCTRFCDEAQAAHQRRVEQQAVQTQQTWQQLQTALATCEATANSFSLFGSKSRRALRVFVDHLAAFARQCLAEDTTDAVQRFYCCLRGKLIERQRDSSLCRQRLRHLQEMLEGSAMDDEEHNGRGSDAALAHTSETFWETMQQTETARVVLPDGEVDLELAAERFVNSLGAEPWAQLDHALQERVLEPLGGMHHICVGNMDLIPNMVGPLLEQAAGFLGEHLPITDVAQVQFAVANGLSEQVLEQVHMCFENAAPLLASQDPTTQQSYLLIPASDAGTAYGEEAAEALPELQAVRVPGQADLMFCREQGYVRPEDLQRIFSSYRGAYQEALLQPVTSPHSRFDVSDWMPLDP